MMAGSRTITDYLGRRGLPAQARSPRARVLPTFVSSRATGLQKPLGPQSFVPVEHDGRQPGHTVPLFAPVPDPDLDIEAAVVVIRRLRGVGPDRPCGFPHDLGCETQLYLGLAVRAIRPDIGIADLARFCRVNHPDAIFFSTLLDLAEGRPWVEGEFVRAAVAALGTTGGVA